MGVKSQQTIVRDYSFYVKNLAGLKLGLMGHMRWPCGRGCLFDVIRPLGATGNARNLAWRPQEPTKPLADASLFSTAVLGRSFWFDSGRPDLNLPESSDRGSNPREASCGRPGWVLCGRGDGKGFDGGCVPASTFN